MLRWRSFAIKFLIGAGIAGSAIAFKDRVPGLQAGAVLDGGDGAAGYTGNGGKSANTVPVAKVASKPNVVRPAPPPVLGPSMLSGHRGGADAVAFTDDGRSLVTAGADATLKVWNASSGAMVRSIQLDEGIPTAFATSGRRAATGHADGRIVLWDIDSGARLARMKRSDAGIASVAFARDGDKDKLLAGGKDSVLAIWDTATPDSQPSVIHEAHDGALSVAAYAVRGAYVATGGEDRVVRLWRADDGHLVRTYRGHKEPVTALAFSPDGRHLAAAAQDGKIRVWSTSSSSLYRLSSSHKGSIGGIAYAPSGEMLASAGHDGSVQLWQLRQGRSVVALAEQGTPARAIAIAPDGRRAAVAGADGGVRFWDVAPTGRDGEKR